MKFLLKNEWFYERPGCDCCEGNWDEVVTLYVDGDSMIDFYNMEDAKAYLLDYIVEQNYPQFTLDVEVEDYPG